jgi:hypothetical protein
VHRFNVERNLPRLVILGGLARDRKPLCVEIDVAPSKVKYFSSAQSGIQRQ